MNKEPVNNGKDIPEIEMHTIHGIGGQKVHALKNKIFMHEPVPYEPKRNNRWTIKFKEPYKDIPQWVLEKTSRPKLINGSWDNIEILLRDVIYQSTSQILVEGFRHNWQVDRIKVPIINYSLEMLDPTGVCIEKWDIKGKIVEADFGSLSYEKDELTKIKLVIEPIKIILEY